ncbi:MAG: T9SS type B sorting domain-containing protein [Bacteroidia bacterium]
MRFILLLLIMLSPLFWRGAGGEVFATHNRAGYISYTYLGNNKYHFKIITYTNPSSYGADRCYQTIFFTNIINPGTGKPDTLNCPRTSFTPGGNLLSGVGGLCPSALAGCGIESSISPSNPGDGLMLVYPYMPSCGTCYGGMKYNTYEGDYTFNGVPAPGGFVFGMVDPNLDNDIINVPSSGSVAFAILDTLSLSNFGANYNNSPLATNAPYDNVCGGQPFHYNPGMTDPDNDSLAFSLIPFITGASNGTSFPHVPGAYVPSGMLVNAVTGDLSWLNAPTVDGEYDVDILIKEYRRVGGQMVEIASTVFVIQLYVVCCSSVVTITPTSVQACIEAGQLYTSPTISATENPNPSSALYMSATGVPLTAPNNATFTSTQGYTTASGVFSWFPTCNNIQLNPYYVTVMAYDNLTTPNANFSTISLQVISPPVTSLLTAVIGDSVKVTWNAPACVGTNTANVIVSYLIYRADNCVQYTVSPCKTGVPTAPPGVSSWYQPIGTCTATTFYDNNNGQGLPAGTTYSYLVVAQYADGSLSMASAYHANTTCITLHLGIPILTNVSVDTTDVTHGKIFVRWHRPFAFSPNLDTLQHPGPYNFVLQRDSVSPGALSTTGTYSIIYTSPAKTYFGQLNTLADTTYTDTLINTYGKQFYYKVLFYDRNGYVGSGNQASSVFANGTGHDKKAVLSWTAHTPWTNTKYYIYRQNYGSNHGYTLVDSTTNTVDTVKHLTNKYSYCFRIMSLGTYYNTNIVSPDTNWSQKVCVTPIDDSPPCQPQLNVVGNCNESITKLTWTNPNNACHINDVLKFYIYYTPRQDSILTKIDSILIVSDTTYTTDYNSANIAGCYVIVAVDSAGNQSPLNNESCADNCPEYELPNIFTPNGDNVNDLYIPVKNRYVRSVDFTLYNRWGEVIYENTDPKLGWDGKSKQMKQPVPDGVYFYTCTVNEIHYYGIKAIKLKGFVQVLK